MCKLMSFTNLEGQSVESLEKLTKLVSKAMYSSERNGFGITLNSEKGLYARRFLSPLDATIKGNISRAPFLKESQNEDGTMGNNIKSIIFHGRTSTNSVSLVNTHPIVKHGLWLSHNGVVEDSGPKYTMLTTNDTEHMVQRLSEGIDAIEKYISGYYATMSYKEGHDEIHIIKDNIASLWCAEVVELKGYVFATTAHLIKSVCKKMGYTIQGLAEVIDNTSFKVSGLDCFELSSIKPKGRSSYADSMADLSLGRSLFSESYDPIQSTAKRAEYDIEDFIYESSEMSDISWEFYWFEQKISRVEFLKLDKNERLDCVVIRSDGTICSADHNNGLLFEGFTPVKSLGT